MSKRELVTKKPHGPPYQDLDELLTLQFPMLAAESSLAKDWLTPEEESAWASL